LCLSFSFETFFTQGRRMRSQVFKVYIFTIFGPNINKEICRLLKTLAFNDAKRPEISCNPFSKYCSRFFIFFADLDYFERFFQLSFLVARMIYNNLLVFWEVLCDFTVRHWKHVTKLFKTTSLQISLNISNTQLPECFLSLKGCVLFALLTW
jgi:hypothetical protein